MRTRSLALLTLTILWLTLPAAAQTILVVPTQFATIQAAINSAQAGDVVVVLPGTYGAFDVNRSIDVVSFTGPAVTTIDLASPASRVSITATGVKLEGFTITNAPDTALDVDGASAEIRDCVFDGNVGLSQITPTATNTVRPGAVLVYDGATGTTFDMCVFVNNVGGDGTTGAFLNGGAGAIYVNSQTDVIALTDCLFRENAGGMGTSAMFGIGIGGPACIGGISSLFTVRFSAARCTFFNNRLVGPMGASVTDQLGSLNSCIAWANTAPGFSQIFFLGIGPFDYNNTQGGVLPGTGNISADPLITGDLLDLDPTSPSRDAGDPSVLPGGRDIIGHPRVIGPRMDMGCNEFAPVVGGSGDPIFVSSTLNGAGADVHLKQAFGGEELQVTLDTDITGNVLPLLLAELFPTNTPPGGVSGFPEVQMNPDLLIVLHDGCNPVAPLPPNGLTFDGGVLPMVSGVTLRFQLLGLSGNAANMIFATSIADDLRW